MNRRFFLEMNLSVKLTNRQALLAFIPWDILCDSDSSKLPLIKDSPSLREEKKPKADVCPRQGVLKQEEWWLFEINILFMEITCETGEFTPN